MADRTEGMMDLDLNLGPVAPTSPVIGPEAGPSLVGEALEDLDAMVEPPFHETIREALRQRTRQRWRWRHLHIPLGANSLQYMVDSDGIGSSPGTGSGDDNEGGGRRLQAGEGSVTAGERILEPAKTCENHVTLTENDAIDEKEDVEKSGIEEGSFFNCNICLDLASEPVVTCCGHLFCWPCIYRWLHIYSDAKECPVCKGEVTLKTCTPIYGRGNHTRDPEEDSGIKIPVRPSARRVESLRQTIQRTASSFPMEEMIRRLGARFELTRDFLQLQSTDDNRDPLEQTAILSRFLTSRALRREQNHAILTEDVVDLTQDRVEIIGQRRLPPLTYRRGQSHIPVDDRDSFSSIAAVIHGESQTVDTAVEIDSMVSLSTSSSRRRNEASRAPDVDSGDSRALRRRRLD